MRKLIYAIPVLALVACGGDVADPTGMPAPALSIAEVERLDDSIADFAVEDIEAWPNTDEFIEDLAEDATFTDPTWADHRPNRDAVIRMMGIMEGFGEFEYIVTDRYLSATGAAFEETWPGLQPPMALPPDPPVASGLTVYEFDDDKILSWDIWYRADDNEAYGIGCFAVDGCPAFAEAVERYLAGWGSHDADRVGALYSDDAVFVDSMLGLEAESADEIGELADRRFGSGGNLTIEALDLYAWTDGRFPTDEYTPDRGGLTGVAIHYLATLEDGGVTETQEGVTTLVLGDLDQARVEVDPQGLIHREEVYHAPESLGVAPAARSSVDGEGAATSGSIEISIHELTGAEGYRVLAVLLGDDQLAGGAFWTIIDSDPFSGADVVHPPFEDDDESNADAWGDDDYLWDETALLAPGRYQVVFAANPGELAPYGSHIPAAGYERGCVADVAVVAGEITELVISDLLTSVGEPCPVVSIG